MSSETNFKFSIEKSTSMQIKTLEKETVHFESTKANYSLVQGLMHSNKYIHLNNPINELAKYLQVTKEELV
jgi:hypothetical protein